MHGLFSAFILSVLISSSASGKEGTPWEAEDFLLWYQATALPLVKTLHEVRKDYDQKRKKAARWSRSPSDAETHRNAEAEYVGALRGAETSARTFFSNAFIIGEAERLLREIGDSSKTIAADLSLVIDAQRRGDLALPKFRSRPGKILIDDSADNDAKRFLARYTAVYSPMSYANAEAQWQAKIDIKTENSAAQAGADLVSAAFIGNEYVVENAQRLWKRQADLHPWTQRQLRTVRWKAADAPATLSKLVRERIQKETRVEEAFGTFDYCLKRDEAGVCASEAVTPNTLDENIRNLSLDLTARENYWSASKDVGFAMRDDLEELRDIRNKVARSMGYSSFFGYRSDTYEMGVDEMMSTLQTAMADIRPLYEQLHCYAKHELAKRFEKDVPRRIPAHWIPNRWAQEWPGLVGSVDKNRFFVGKTPKDIVGFGEGIYTSMGFSDLPASFWEKSDLYELPANAERRKDAWASAWDMNRSGDVRSLMSVRADWYWFTTVHHELGHIYYDLAYARPDLPFLLREYPVIGWTEAIAMLTELAASDEGYLRRLGLLGKNEKVDRTAWLLSNALEGEPVFLPFAVGAMTEFEQALYEDDLPKERFNEVWWDLAGKHQGIEPPSQRGSDGCDACSKYHTMAVPAYYYNYAFGSLIKYQLHEHICRKILRTTPQNCNFHGKKEVGRYLNDLMKRGATESWVDLLKIATGEGLSGRAMLAYFEPLVAWLKDRNKGRDCSF